MKRWWVGLVICVCGSVLMARPGVVHTRDGLTYDGDVTETENTITVRVRGIATTLDRSSVASIAYGENIAADIEARWKKLQPADVRGRLALGKEAFEARQYLLARKILQEALDIDPNNRAAADLYDLSRAQIDLERKKSTTAEAPLTTSGRGTPTRPVTTTTPAGLTNDRKYLSALDINNIREMEITQRDTNIRIRVDPDLARRFTIGSDVNPAEFRARSALDQFLAVRASGRADFLRSVHVLSDPQTIIEFRRDVQPPILAGCAASNCHGSPAHWGNFQLLNEVTEPAVYTNFYNLVTYVMNVPGGGGVFNNGTQRRMIDRAQPENSLLLQYMLPPEMAATPHPGIRNFDYRGVVKSREDARYQRIAAWIGGTLSPTEPQYNVTYRPAFLNEAGPGSTNAAPAPAPIPAPAAVPAAAPARGAAPLPASAPPAGR
jgi:hypothetical protein